MKILTYLATDPDTPEGFRAMARIRCDIPTKGGAMQEDWHPIVFSGPDVETLREMAQQWWDSEIAKAEVKKPRGRPKKDAATPADDIGDVI